MHLDWTGKVGVFESPDDHAEDGHADAEPVEEAEVGDQAPDVTNEQEDDRHHTVEENGWHWREVGGVDHGEDVG